MSPLMNIRFVKERKKSEFHNKVMSLSYKGPWTRRIALVYSQHKHGGGSSYTFNTGFRFKPTNEEDSGDYGYSWL